MPSLIHTKKHNSPKACTLIQETLKKQHCTTLPLWADRQVDLAIYNTLAIIFYSYIKIAKSKLY